MSPLDPMKTTAPNTLNLSESCPVQPDHIRADVWSFEIPIPPKDVQEELAQALIRVKAEAVRMKELAEEIRKKTREEVEERVMGKDSGRT